MDFLCHRKKKKIWKWLMLYFGTWSGFVSYAIYFALLHVRQLLSVCAVILSTAPISWCCRSVFMAYGCWYHSLCFLLVCLDYQRGCHWAGEAIKGYLIPFHAKYIYIQKKTLLEWMKEDYKNEKNEISSLTKTERRNAGEKKNSTH